jgi:hypothetical protein
VGGYAPRAREDSVRPRRLSGATGRPLNFTVRRLRSARDTSADEFAHQGPHGTHQDA